MTKKIVFIVLTFAVVAALLTLATHPESMMMRDNSYAMKDDRMGMTMPMPATESIDFQQIQPEMGKVSISARPAMGPMGTSDIAYNMIAPAPGLGYGGDALSVDQRVEMKYSSQGLLVANVNDTMKQLKDYLQTQGGRVLSSSQSVMDDMEFGFITAKVPSAKFEQITTEIAGKARKVMQESINSTDVTGQKTNLDDRVKTYQDQKTKRMADFEAAKTAADKKLIQADIDRLDAQITNAQKTVNQFAEETSFSTVQISVSDSERYFNPSVRPSLHTEVKRAWESLGGTSKSIAYFLVWVVVYAVIWLPIVLIFRWIVKKLTPARSGK